MQKLITSLLLGAALMMGGSIDGKWSFSDKVRPKGRLRSVDVIYTMNLRETNGKLTGTISINAKQKSGETEIEEGKVDGNNFSFVTTMKNAKDGPKRIEWRGTVDGNTLKGTHTGLLKTEDVEFTAKRI